MVVQCSMRRVSKQTWEQIKVAYASGIGLRELARRMNLPEGTVLAHAKRHGWTQRIEQAKTIVLQPQSDAIAPSPMQSAAVVIEQRGERYRERMAGVSEKVAGHLESLDADEILLRGAQVEKIDNVARRTFGLDSPQAGSGAVNLNVLCGGRAVVQVNQKNE